MFGFSKPGRTGRTRSRDGWKLLSSSERRRRRKASGLSHRQQKKVTKANRRYKKGWF